MKRLFVLQTMLLVAVFAYGQKLYVGNDDRTYCRDMESIARKIVSIPDIDGYLTLKGDFHMHTVFADAEVSASGRVREAWFDGLDIIAMTEHVGVHKNEGIHITDYNLSNKLAIKAGKKYGLLVVPGMEITRTKPFGHINALFIKDCNGFEENRYLLDEKGNLLRDKDGKRIPNRATEMSDFEKAEAQGAFMMWNHPGWPDGKSTLYPLHKKLIEEGRIDAIELFNGMDVYPRVLDWYDTYKVPMMANSDIHTPSSCMYGRTLRPMTLVFAKERTIESVREAMFAGRILALYSNTLAGDADLIKQIIEKSLQIRVIDEKNGKIEVTNISDIQFEALFDNPQKIVTFYPRSAVQYKIPQGTELDFKNCLAGRKSVKIKIW